MRLRPNLCECPEKLAGILILLLTLLPGLALGCRHLPPPPEGFNPQDYTPVTIEQLQDPRRAGLSSGQKVSVSGYFWQFPEYDPYMVARYLALARRPLVQSRLRWAALYNSPQLQGYYDRLVLTVEQRQDLHLKRLEQVRVYGVLTDLGFGFLYLKARQVDRLDVEGVPPGRKTPAPAYPAEETPNP
jgi:hypothetical protein